MTYNVIKLIELHNQNGAHLHHDNEETCSVEHCDCHEQAIAVKDNVVNGPSFLLVTGKSTSSNLKGLVYAADNVISGEVKDETDKIIAETNDINSIINQNVNGTELSVNSVGSSVFQPKVITFEKYSKSTEFADISATNDKNSNIKSYTNVNKLISSFQYSNLFNESEQKKILTGAVHTLADWLDDYINNYDERVAEGIERGDSEMKLSFLLKLRKAIENCDFPVGFGNDEYFQSESSDGYVVLGAYSNSSYSGMYLNPFDNASDNNAAIQHTNRNITLNASLFVLNRAYKTEKELVNGINAGDFDYLAEEFSSQDEKDAALNKAYTDVILSSDEVYYNYVEAYLASVLAHEFIHSTHIANEAVTYNTCEMLEDDFRHRLISTNWSQKTQDAVNKIYDDFILNELEYDDVFIPTSDGGGLTFHNLYAYNVLPNSNDNVVKHGYNENMTYEDIVDEDGEVAYKAWKNFTTGNTLEDARKEIMNFVV